MVSEFYESYRNRHQLAEGWKLRGRKLVGYFCSLTPEELIYAAGLIPVRIRGTVENISLADAHLPSFCCSYMRGAIDQVLRGRSRRRPGTDESDRRKVSAGSEVPMQAPRRVQIGAHP